MHDDAVVFRAKCCLFFLFCKLCRVASLPEIQWNCRSSSILTLPAPYGPVLNTICKCHTNLQMSYKSAFGRSPQKQYNFRDYWMVSDEISNIEILQSGSNGPKQSDVTVPTYLVLNNLKFFRNLCSKISRFQVSEWVSNWVSEWVGGSMVGGWVREWVSEWVSACMRACVHACVRAWMSEWVVGRSVGRWVGGWVTRWVCGSEGGCLSEWVN